MPSALAQLDGRTVDRTGRSPAASRRRLGVELRDLREAAGKKIEEAAKALDCSTAKISRLENGKGVPYQRDIRDLINIYGRLAQARSDDLMALVEEGRAQDWYSNFRDVLQGEMSADHVNRFFELERDADVIKQFDADLIPGLLQTERYIEAICSIVYPENAEKERRRFVQFRLERQETVLRRGRRPDLNLIMHELAIFRRIGDAAVMRQQLDDLHTKLTGELSDIDFRITPLTAEARGALGGPFCILKYASPDDQDLVYLEGREGATWLEADADVTRFEGLFSGLERDSLSRDDSVKRLAQAVEQLSQEVELGH